VNEEKVQSFKNGNERTPSHSDVIPVSIPGAIPSQFGSYFFQLAAFYRPRIGINLFKIDTRQKAQKRKEETRYLKSLHETTGPKS